MCRLSDRSIANVVVFCPEYYKCGAIVHGVLQMCCYSAGSIADLLLLCTEFYKCAAILHGVLEICCYSARSITFIPDFLNIVQEIAVVKRKWNSE